MQGRGKQSVRTIQNCLCHQLNSFLTNVSWRPQCKSGLSDCSFQRCFLWPSLVSVLCLCPTGSDIFITSVSLGLLLFKGNKNTTKNIITYYGVSHQYVQQKKKKYKISKNINLRMHYDKKCGTWEQRVVLGQKKCYCLDSIYKFHTTA